MDRALQLRLSQAAEVVSQEAQRIAVGFSRRTAAATHVVSNRRGVFVITDGALAPQAAPFQWAERHPLFGNRHWWYKQPHRPYMSVAAARAIDGAANQLAEVLSDWVDEVMPK